MQHKPYLWPYRRNFRVLKEIRVEIRLFRACAIKNVQRNPYLWANRLNFCVLKEIGVEEHHGEVRFKSESGNGRSMYA